MASILAMLGMIIFALLSAVQAHMQLYYPPPFNASNNPHTQGPGDPELLFPYDCCGKTTPYPCRGYLSMLGTSEGASVATWPAGSQQNWSLTGPAPYGGNHWGGSCQIGFSTDNGETFRVVVSYEGDCPHRGGGQSPSGQTFNFTVPEDLPSGDVVFAWVWYNRELEFFMNCAAVTISDGSGTATSPSSSPPAPAASALPPGSASTTSTGAETYQLGDCTCTCPPGTSSSKLRFRRDFTLSSCDCTCASTPSSTANNKHRLLRSLADPDIRILDNPLGPVLEKRYTSAAFADRPLMFIADPKHGCNTPHTTAELKFPEPGPDLVPGDGAYPLVLPSGTCTNPAGGQATAATQ